MLTKHKRNIYKGHFAVLPLLILISYFCYHLYYGRYGIYANAQTAKQISCLEKEVETLKQRRSALQDKIHRLQQGSIEKDMLDEQLRRNFNLLQKNEVVIFLKPKIE